MPAHDDSTALEAQVHYWRSAYEDLVRNLPNAVFLVDPATEGILEANDAACRLLGYARERLLAEVRIWDLHPEEMDEIRDFAGAVMRDGAATTERLGCLSAHGLYIPVRMHGMLTRAADGRTLIRTIVVDDLQRRLTEQALLDQVRESHDFEEITGTSPALRAVLQQVERVAPTDSTVLILGESGTGKELVCRALHDASLRRERPMVKLNCAAIPSGLIESELFGHERGAFTGAIQQKRGRFELAHEGTIFLDEIGDIPLDTQPKLLRLLQEQEFERVGGADTIDVDVRVIAATHRDLPQMVRDGTFRQDLFYRLNVFPVELPPLRERPEDVDVLARYFVHRKGIRLGRPGLRLSDAALARLRAYRWPGNIRELENIIERAVILCDGDCIEPQHVQGLEAAAPGGAAGDPLRTLQEMERDHIIAALKATAGKISGQGGAAELLGLKPSTLESRMKRLGLRRDQVLSGAEPPQASK